MRSIASAWPGCGRQGFNSIEIEARWYAAARNNQTKSARHQGATVPPLTAARLRGSELLEVVNNALSEITRATALPGFSLSLILPYRRQCLPSRTDGYFPHRSSRRTSCPSFSKRLARRGSA